MKVRYPNRKLSMQYAAVTPAEDAYAPTALANVALANLVGDNIRIHRDETLTVQNNRNAYLYTKAGTEQKYGRRKALEHLLRMCTAPSWEYARL